MSEAEDDAAVGRDDVWVEKYRPRRLEDVAGHDTIVERVQQYVADDDLPNLLFAGPAGVGKCVTGETPVLTNRGLTRIEDVVGDADGFADPDDDLQVLTFDDGDFEYESPAAVFGKCADETVTIETRDGNESTATPEHRFLVATEAGLEWRRAADLAPGDRIARPLAAPTPPDDQTVDWIEALDGSRIHVHLTEEFANRYDVPVEERFVGGKKQAIRGFRTGASDAEIAEDADVRRKTVTDYRRKTADVDLEATSTECSLSYLERLDVDREELRDHVVGIQYVTRSNKRAAPISPIWECSPAVAEFLGLAVSEARIERGRIKFYNTDDSLLDRFEHLAESLFDIDPRRGEQNGVRFVSVQSRTLVHFLNQCFDVLDLGESDRLASTLLEAPEASQAAFLRAMFDAEAYVSGHGIVELTQKNESYVTLLAYLLAGFGIPCRRSVQQKSATNGEDVERKYHTLEISGARHLRRFQARVGFSVAHKSERLRCRAGGETNPNHDTIPVQQAVDDLCDDLHLQKTALCTESLDPETPGRAAYLEDLDAVLDAASERIEAAQNVLETVERLRSDVRSLSSVPGKWVGDRDALQPAAVRRELEPTVGARSDYLLEYARGEFTPRANRTATILEELGSLERGYPLERVQTTLGDAIDRLGVSFNQVAEGTEYRGTDVRNLLERDDLALESLSRFEVVAERVIDVASAMLRTEVLQSLRTLEVFARGTLYFDEVASTERSSESRRVYDLTVPGTHNYVAGDVPTVMHNTTTAHAIAREIYGEDWDEHFLELNASDERGIDVVRGRIKDFARSAFGDVDFRIIFLDEADALTSEAQSALRRTMEQFSGNTRFVLSCNYSSRIIDPIQSRCAVFRFPPLSDDAVREQVQRVADEEGVEVSESGLDALAYVADGDMRRAINALQAAATTADVVDEDAVYEITSSARPEEVLELVEHALDGDFLAARAALEELLIDRGIAGGDVIDQLHRSVWDLEIDESAAVRLMDRVGETEYRIVEGADERIQLEAMLASLALEE